MDRSIHGGEATLAPLILRGVAKSVSYLAGRVEGMVYKNAPALTYVLDPGGLGPGGHAAIKQGSGSKSSGGVNRKGAAPTVEQDHNHQLLQLVRTPHRNPPTQLVRPGTEVPLLNKETRLCACVRHAISSKDESHHFCQFHSACPLATPPPFLTRLYSFFVVGVIAGRWSS